MMFQGFRGEAQRIFFQQCARRRLDLSVCVYAHMGRRGRSRGTADGAAAALAGYQLPCEADAAAASDVHALLIATVPGDDTAFAPLLAALRQIRGAAVCAAVGTPDTLVTIARPFPALFAGYRVAGLASGRGWAHLAEFASRWVGLIDKSENASHPDYPYFSQFRRSARDGFTAANSEFRPMEELSRRRIKPAWIQYFNARAALHTRR